MAVQPASVNVWARSNDSLSVLLAAGVQLSPVEGGFGSAAVSMARPRSALSGRHREQCRGSVAAAAASAVESGGGGSAGDSYGAGASAGGPVVGSPASVTVGTLGMAGIVGSFGGPTPTRPLARANTPAALQPASRPAATTPTVPIPVSIMSAAAAASASVTSGAAAGTAAASASGTAAMVSTAAGAVTAAAAASAATAVAVMSAGSGPAPPVTSRGSLACEGSGAAIAAGSSAAPTSAGGAAAHSAGAHSGPSAALASMVLEEEQEERPKPKAKKKAKNLKSFVKSVAKALGLRNSGSAARQQS
ncbi:hypothetical protein GPECTOR_75g719 [Gonium pectorale]|uniref:Uncharacterized protein n=1 Tax=Gonium pectorale TaxID=33097 RepID=A0A150G2A6_GONPE|nr:hypothetical protein GPECTOR_75g719 [Gonium pectorale]|eukprot:KXZ43996.1 hypothetical protein GPECTOR_75g719 [Gonium pectorale]